MKKAYTSWDANGYIGLEVTSIDRKKFWDDWNQNVEKLTEIEPWLTKRDELMTKFVDSK